MNSLEIKRLREKLGYTQEQLGFLIGVSRNTIINYEKGGKIPPAKSKLLHNVLIENAQNTTFVNEPPTIYETPMDKKIAENEEKIKEAKAEITKWEQKILERPENKKEYEAYISGYEKQIHLLNEIINTILEAKNDFLKND